MHYFFENYDSGLGAFEDETEIKGTMCINKFGIFVETKKGDDYYLCDYIQEPTEELEVIGNIYDNPELLKEEI